MNADLWDRLLNAARQAAELAYCPYSRFHVGAAVLVAGQVISGCNIENASYGLTICAERVAIFRAIATGLVGRLEAMALSSADALESSGPESRMPCGACRQVMAEFANPEMPVWIDGVGVVQLAELLPRAFLLSRGQENAT